MNSYQRLKEKIRVLQEERNALLKELEAKGNAFFVSNKWLGVNRTVFGTVVNGILIQTSESNGRNR